MYNVFLLIHVLYVRVCKNKIRIYTSEKYELIECNNYLILEN
jgi:hypothetical protein